MSKYDSDMVQLIVEQLESRTKDVNFFEGVIQQFGRDFLLINIQHALSIADKSSYIGFSENDASLLFIAAGTSSFKDKNTEYFKTKRSMEYVKMHEISDGNLLYMALSSPAAETAIEFRRRLNSQSFVEAFRKKCDEHQHSWYLRDEYYSNGFLLSDMLDAWEKAPGVKYAFNFDGIVNSKDKPINLSVVHKTLSRKALYIETILGERGNALTPLLSMINSINGSKEIYGLREECDNILNYSRDISNNFSNYTISASDRQKARDVISEVIPSIINKSVDAVLEFRKSYYTQPRYDVMSALKKVLVGISIVNDECLQPNCSMNDDFVACVFGGLSADSDLVADTLPRLIKIKAVKNKDYLPVADAAWKCKLLRNLVSRDDVLTSQNKYAKGVLIEQDLGI